MSQTGRLQRVPPTDRFVISFAAEPHQEGLPYGRWADTLASHFLAACKDIDTHGAAIGASGDIAWFPDRTYGGRTSLPAVARSRWGYDLFGFLALAAGASIDAAVRLLTTGSVSTVDLGRFEAPDA